MIPVSGDVGKTKPLPECGNLTVLNLDNFDEMQKKRQGVHQRTI